MPIRHVVEEANLDEEGFIIDPAQARHCVIHAGRLLDLSGPVDPLTHLNLDFPDHRLEVCVIAERLEPGARVRIDPERGFLMAVPRPTAFQSRGRVDLDARRVAWLQVHQQRRQVAR